VLEAITMLHETTPTHQHGQVPIDGTFVSPTILDQARGGYLEFNDGLESDQKGLWVDMSPNPLVQ